MKRKKSSLILKLICIVKSILTTIIYFSIQFLKMTSSSTLLSSSSPQIIARWAEIENKIEQALKILKSSDFHPKDGMNETSLKAILIQQLLNELHHDDNIDLKIKSEEFIKDRRDNTRFIDLLIENKQERYAVIVELKYIRATFLLDERGRNFVNGDFESRRTLNDAVVRFRDKSKRDILKMKKREFDGTHVTIQHVLNNALKQAENYSRSHRFTNTAAHFDTIYIVSCVGVLNKILSKIKQIE